MVQFSVQNVLLGSFHLYISKIIEKTHNNTCCLMRHWAHAPFQVILFVINSATQVYRVSIHQPNILYHSSHFRAIPMWNSHLISTTYLSSWWLRSALNDMNSTHLSTFCENITRLVKNSIPDQRPWPLSTLTWRTDLGMLEVLS